MTPETYAPRSDTIAGRVLRILEDGPMTSGGLGEELGISAAAVSASLAIAHSKGLLEREAIRVAYSCRPTSLWSLPEGEDDRGAGKPRVKHVDVASVRPSREAIAAANPFGRSMGRCD